MQKGYGTIYSSDSFEKCCCSHPRLRATGRCHVEGGGFVGTADALPQWQWGDLLPAQKCPCFHAS